MKWLQRLKPVGLFLLLLLVVTIPFPLMQWQENQTLGVVHRFLAEGNSVIADPSQTESREEADAASTEEMGPSQSLTGDDVGSLWEKLAMTQDDRIIRKRTEGDILSNEKKEELLAALEGQLLALGAYCKLPELSFSDPVLVSVNATSYMDATRVTYVVEDGETQETTEKSDSGSSGKSYSEKDSSVINYRNVFQVWGLEVEYKGFHVTATMDQETQALLFLSLKAGKKAFTYEQENREQPGFLEYLSSVSSLPPESAEERFSANYVYGEREVQIYLSSVNPKTNQELIYRFQ